MHTVVDENGAVSAVAAADLDADGIVELAWAARDTDQLWIAPGTGGGLLLAPFELDGTPNVPTDLRIVDLDGDGNPDVIMPVYLQTVPQDASCKVSLVRNNTVVKASTSYKVI